MNNFSKPVSDDESRHALISRVARRVREVRKQKGLPRRVLSERSDVSPRYLAQLEAGEGNISIALLERVARALDVPMEALIAPQIAVDAEAQRIARLFDAADETRRAQVRSILEAGTAGDLRKGRICLMGLRGAGKTTLGKMAAEALDLPFVELGSLIQSETGMPLDEVLSLYGADGYRRLEADALERVMKQEGPVMLSVSSGLVEQEAPFKRLLERFHTVWLRTSPEEHVSRVRAQGDMAPIKDQPGASAKIAALMEMRGPLYGRADVVLDTAGQVPQRSLRDLIALLRERGFVTLPDKG